MGYMKKEFKSGKAQIIKLWIEKTLIAWTIGMTGYCLTITLIGKKVTDYDFNAVLSIVIAAIIGLIYTLLFSIVTIIVDQEKIQFIRRGKVYKEFSFKTHKFGSYVMKYSYNLIPLTTRYLTVVDLQKSKLHNYSCPFFSRETFEQFITYVTNPNKTIDNMENVTSTDNGQLQQYTFPKEEFLNKSKKNYTRNFILVLAMPVILIVLMFATNRDEEMIVALTAFSVMFMLPFMGICLYLKAKRNELKNKTPNEIKIDKNNIVMDKEIFNVSKIEHISLTPPKYLIARLNPVRKLIIKYNRKTYTYFLGYAIKGDETFKEYGKFYDEVKRMFEKDEGKFTKNLER